MATGDLRQKFSGTRDNNLDFPEQLRARRTPTLRHGSMTGLLLASDAEGPFLDEGVALWPIAPRCVGDELAGGLVHGGWG